MFFMKSTQYNEAKLTLKNGLDGCLAKEGNILVANNFIFHRILSSLFEYVI